MYGDWRFDRRKHTPRALKPSWVMQNNIIIVQSIIYTILDVLVAEQNSNYHNAEF